MNGTSIVTVSKVRTAAMFEALKSSG